MTQRQDGEPAGGFVPARTPRVVLSGVPADRLGALYGLNVVPPGVVDSSTADVLVLHPMTTQALETEVASFRAVVEFREGDDSLGGRIGAAARTPGFHMAFTTGTAFSHLDAAKALCAVLESRGILPHALRANVELAVHETVANGLLHGNLNADMQLLDDTDYYPAFCEHLQNLLENPQTSGRWIEITASWTDAALDVAVEDQGDGYDPNGADGVCGEEAAHGRGLAIVSALASEVTVSRGGRRTLLRFAYEP